MHGGPGVLGRHGRVEDVILNELDADLHRQGVYIIGADHEAHGCGRPIAVGNAVDQYTITALRQAHSQSIGVAACGHGVHLPIIGPCAGVIIPYPESGPAIILKAGYAQHPDLDLQRVYRHGGIPVYPAVCHDLE